MGNIDPKTLPIVFIIGLAEPWIVCSMADVANVPVKITETARDSIEKTFMYFGMPVRLVPG
jgi:hypothetical protein